MLTRRLGIAATVLLGLGSANAAPPREDQVRRCSAVLGLVAQDRVVDAIDVAGRGGAPDGDLRAANIRGAESALIAQLKPLGGVVGRKRLPNHAVDGAPATITLERWDFANGEYGHFGCVGYEVAGGWVLHLWLDGDAEAVIAALSRSARERDDS